MHLSSENSQLRSLATMARALGRSRPLFQLVEIAGEEARSALGAASVSVSRLEGGSFTVRTIINVGDLGPREVRWPQDEVYTIDEFANLDLIVANLQTWTADLLDPDCPEDERALLLDLEKGSSLGAPIVVDGQLWGEFYATRHVGDPTFGETETSYLEALVAILAGAISRALQEESLERLASQDPLTGLLNRRAFDERSAKAFELPPGVQRDITVVACDINGLKEVNDTLGHTAGDQLIQAVARALTKQFSRFPGALVARIGGDEFCVLVARQEPALVIRMADELCRMTWDFGTGAGVSCGATSATVSRGSDVKPTDLFVAADRAQYVAKRGQLSRTVVANELTDLHGPSTT
jgi:diguanylate cyclase (GGDEF)-like protein